jgi:outer membrane protein assembly factor BamB
VKTSAVADATTESAPIRTAGRGQVGIGVLAAGLLALVAALVLSIVSANADGLPLWARAVALVLLGIGVVSTLKWLAPTTRRRWLIGLGIGAAGLAAWALFAIVTEVWFGLLGVPIPVVALGCVAVVVATVLLAGSPPALGFVARQASSAVAALLAIGVLAAVTVVFAPRIVVDATSAERVDPAAVPDPSAGVRWTSTWQPEEGQTVRVVAAGAGVIVATGDQIVALNGPTGAQRWHYRRAGAHAYRLAASPDGRTAVATFTADDSESNPTSSEFAFDANTGEVLWTRWPVNLWRTASQGGLATDHTFVKDEPGGVLVGVDLGSGEEIWRWTPPSGCTADGNYVAGAKTVLVPVSCGAKSSAVIGVDDRAGTQRWRTAGPTESTSDDIRLTVSPDGRATLYESGKSGSMLLDSATGAVLYPADGDGHVVTPDLRTPVLLNTAAGLRVHLVVHDLRTKAEHPLASTCPTSRRHVVIAAESILVLCAGPNATNTVFARADGTGIGSMAGFADQIPDSPDKAELFPAAGAIVLVVHGDGVDPTVVSGLA